MDTHGRARSLVAVVAGAPLSVLGLPPCGDTTITVGFTAGPYTEKGAR